MRHRKVHGKEEILKVSESFIVHERPEDLKGSWGSLFGEDRKDLPLRLEIGSGKGRFIVRTAQDFPEVNFLACEGSSDVYIRILQKAADAGLTNLRLICGWMDRAAECFAPGELEGIYLNFCDPWPKKRHEKRRLTSPEKTAQYSEVLTPGGFVRFKTDNDALFEYSLESFRLAGFCATEMSRDLHGSIFASGSRPTEYEDKFSGAGKNINYLLAEKRREQPGDLCRTVRTL